MVGQLRRILQFSNVTGLQVLNSSRPRPQHTPTHPSCDFQNISVDTISARSVQNYLWLKAIQFRMITDWILQGEREISLPVGSLL